MQAAPSQGQGRPGGASRLLFCPVGSCSSLLSLLSPASLVSIWAGRGPCWAPTAVSSAQALRLWSLAGWGLSSPPPTPSWAPPSFPLPSPWSGALAWGPSLCGGGRASPLSRVSAPLPPGGLGVPTLRVPHLSPTQAAVAWSLWMNKCNTTYNWRYNLIIKLSFMQGDIFRQHMLKPK